MTSLSFARRPTVIAFAAAVTTCTAFFHPVYPIQADGGQYQPGMGGIGTTTGVLPGATGSPRATGTPVSSTRAVPRWVWIALPVALVAVGITAWQIGRPSSDVAGR